MKMKSNAGFTLVEVVIALGVLAFGIMAMFGLQALSIRGNADANGVTTRATLSADRIEAIIPSSYQSNDFRDNDNDGTNQDPDHNGTDNDGGNYGLDDIGVAADGSRVTADGRHNVFWNVAVDYPADNAKTVNVITVDNASGKQVSVSYIVTKPL